MRAATQKRPANPLSPFLGVRHESKPVKRHDDFPPFLDESENPAGEWLDRLDCVLTRLHTERGSFAAALAEIGERMDWLVDAYARDGKPWLSPMELLGSATDSYEDCDHA